MSHELRLSPPLRGAASSLRLAALLALAAALIGAAALRAQAISVGPSAHCHVVDGTFTDCAPAPGREEWSDIDFLPFPSPEAAEVYTDQSLSPPNLHLMYDLVGRNVPLGPAESFDIRFDVVEDGHLEHYLVQVFGDGHIALFEDGEPITYPTGITGAVGFGPSPGRPGFFDVFVEIQVPMNVVYSPDIPLFWSTAAPPRPPCQPGQPGCCDPREPGCQPPRPPTGLAAASAPVSATIVSANSDGTTVVVAVPLDATPADLCTPSGGGVLGDLIDALVPPGGSHRNHGEYVRQVTEKSRQAVDSLINSQVLTRAEGEALHACVVRSRARSDAGKN